MDQRHPMALPQAARQTLGIEVGGSVLVVVEDQSVRLLPKPETWTDYIYGPGEELWATISSGETFLEIAHRPCPLRLS